MGPPAAAGDRSLGLASASSFVGGDEGFEGVGGMGPPPPRRAERQGDRGADRGWEGGGGSSRGRAPVDDRAFDMDVDAGASARDLAATLDFEYVDRKPAAIRDTCVSTWWLREGTRGWGTPQTRPVVGSVLGFN